MKTARTFCRRLGAASALVVLTAAVAVAQSFDLVPVGGTLPVGGTVNSRVLLDGDTPALAFEYEVAFDDQALELAELASGVALETVNGGDPPDFEIFDIFPGGFLHGVQVDFDEIEALPPGSGLELSVATYAAAPGFAGPTTVATVYGVFVSEIAGAIVSTDASVGSATILVEAPFDPSYLFSMSGPSTYGDEFVELDVLLDIEAAASSLTGWSWGIEVSGSGLFAEEILEGTTVLTVNGGAPPDFIDQQIWPNGFTQVVTIDFGGVFVLAPGSGYQLASIFLEPTGAGEEVNLVFGSDVGDPPVAFLVFPFLGIPLLPDATPYCLTTGLGFIRGDCNDDATISLPDAVFELGFLFQMGELPHCEDACDVNDNGGLGLDDVVFSLNFQFGGGPPPPGSQFCGPDVGGPPDDLECAQSACAGP